MNAHDHEGDQDLTPGALERTVRADLEALDLGGPLARSYAETAYNLARKLDQDAGMASAAVARELRETLKIIEGAAGDDDGAALLTQLSTPVGDTAPPG